MISLFTKKDPICGMEKKKYKGKEKHGEWFCSDPCLVTYEKNLKKKSKGCC